MITGEDYTKQKIIKEILDGSPAPSEDYAECLVEALK